MSDINYVNKPIMNENVQITKQKLAQKQPKTLETPLTVLGQTETSVEGALGAINDKERVLTQAQYNALTPAEKTNGVTYYISDAGDGTTVLVEGYYNTTDGKFYEESTYTTEIVGQTNTIYVDLNTNRLYIYQSSTSSFVGVSGGADNIKFGYYNETDGKFYEDSSYTTEIPANASNIYIGLDNDTIYRYDTTNTEYVSIGGGGTTYTAGFGINIDNDEIKTTDFVGTQADWDALTQVQKDAYDFVNITDDTNNVPQGATGHFINNGNTEMTQRATLEFDGFNVTDDSTNGRTKVAEVPYTAGDGIDITNKVIGVADEIARTWTGTQAEWNAIVDKSPYDGWIINITDDYANGMSPVVDVVEDGNMNAVTSNAVYQLVKRTEIPITNVLSSLEGCIDAYEENGVVHLSVNKLNGVNLSAGWNDIFTIPSAYIPSNYVSVPCVVQRGGVGGIGEMRVNLVSGTVTVYSIATTNQCLFAQLEYRL